MSSLVERRAIKQLFRHAEFERRNACEVCGRQMIHKCGMGACFDVCPYCEPVWADKP